MLNKRIKNLLLKSFSLFACCTLFCFSASQAGFAKETMLKSGPMVGYSEMTEVLLWVQTDKAAKVKFQYWDKAKPAVRYSTEEVLTSESRAFTAKLTATKLQPGKKYAYELYINSAKVDRPYPLEFKTQTLWQFRTDPPNFKIAMGSCTYVNEPEVDRPGKPYGGDYGIFKSIYNKHPDLMLWLGDNTYLREVDWFSRSGIFYRYTHTRSLPEMQPLLASASNYAMLDDHDFGQNDSDRSYRNQDDALDAFRLFWGNPTFGTKDNKAAFTKFEWADVEVFMLDDRTFRTPEARKSGVQTMIGENQYEWLIDSLTHSSATFKIVAIGGQVLNPVKLDYVEDYSNFPEEKEKLLSEIEKENIKGVIFVTGDRHQSELSMLKREGAYPLYDFTVSPLTAGPYDSSKENNYLRVPGTLYADHNFGVMDISGPRKDRKLIFSLYDKNGKELWNRTIMASELK
jgi:alkaline phosphatase D